MEWACVWQVYHNTNNKHDLFRVQHLLRAMTTSSTAWLASRGRDVHRALHACWVSYCSHLAMAMAPKNRKIGSECVNGRIVPVRMCASVRSRWCVCTSDRRRIDVGRFLFILAMYNSGQLLCIRQRRFKISGNIRYSPPPLDPGRPRRRHLKCAANFIF